MALDEVISAAYCVFFTLKNNSSLLAMGVPWRIYNIHKSFLLHKRPFTVE